MTSPGRKRDTLSEVWTVGERYIKGPRADCYPLLFERVHGTQADMHLAAAAPELLAALTRLVVTEGWNEETRQAARAAITKATEGRP